MKRIAILGSTQATDNVLGAFPGRLTLVQNPAEADLVIAASGVALKEALEALKRKIPVALVCPELMVLAGDELMAASRAYAAAIIPADPTLSAIWQCLRGEPSPVQRLVLVSSDDMAALGARAIAAHHLFGIPYERMEMVNHPQGVVQAIVEFADGAMKTVFAEADPRRSLLHALSYPERWDDEDAPLVDLVALRRLTFEPNPCIEEAIATARYMYPPRTVSPP